MAAQEPGSGYLQPDHRGQPVPNAHAVARKTGLLADLGDSAAWKRESPRTRG